MGRRNSRGLELSFKPLKGGRGRGRWFKKFNGKAVYFGWAEGVTDRNGYQVALAAYRVWLADAETRRTRPMATGLTRRLQFDFSAPDEQLSEVDLPAVREKIEKLRQLGGSSVGTFERLANTEEKRRLIESMQELSLDEIRDMLDRLENKQVAGDAVKTTGTLLDEFLATQRQRMERRQKLDKLREEGQAVREAAKQNLSEGRFASIARDVAAMKRSVGNEPWDRTEATAARIIRKFREDSDKPVLAGKSPHTFNDLVKVARMFCAWTESTYQLDRLPRDKSLFSKYSTSQSTAKAIPVSTLKKLWKASDDRGRCWLLLGLNCGYYAQDIANLTREMLDGEFLNHTRAKTGVKVRYALWPTTRAYLKKFTPKTGRIFSTDTGKPLVHYAKLKKTGEPVRVDNVRNWFYRLCKDQDVAGFSFSNVRDTASTQVEEIDKGMTDLFLAHRDPRMAALYVDGEMTNPAPLKRITAKLEKRFSPMWTKSTRDRKGHTQ